MCHSSQLTVTCYMHASDILISYWKTWPAFNMISFSPENILISISLFSGSDSSLPQYSGLVPLICAAISMSQTHACEFIKICLDCLEICRDRVSLSKLTHSLSLALGIAGQCLLAVSSVKLDWKNMQYLLYNFIYFFRRWQMLKSRYLDYCQAYCF